MKPPYFGNEGATTFISTQTPLTRTLQIDGNFLDATLYRVDTYRKCGSLLESVPSQNHFVRMQRSQLSIREVGGLENAVDLL